MANPSTSASNRFQRIATSLCHGLGFSKGYNAILCVYTLSAEANISISPFELTKIGFLTIGYLFGFTLARLEYLSFNGIFCDPNGAPGTGAAPGECYYWLQNPFQIGTVPATHGPHDSETNTLYQA